MMYMDMEGYVAIFFMLVLGYMAAWFLIECFVKPTYYWIKNSYKERKAAKIPTITMEEIMQLIEQNEFDNMVKEVLEGRVKNTEPLENNPYLTVLVPCEFHNCPQHVTRADCCESCVEKDGKAYCKRLIHFDSMEERGMDRSGNEVLLTKEECELFAKLYVDWIAKLKRLGIYRDTPMMSQ